jgi:hypothetical protein
MKARAYARHGQLPSSQIHAQRDALTLTMRALIAGRSKDLECREVTEPPRPALVAPSGGRPAASFLPLHADAGATRCGRCG